MLIVEPDLSPRRTVYFTAALVLRAFREPDVDTIDLATLVRLVKSIDVNAPIEAIVSALDFLFLIGRVRITDQGGLQCS